MSFALHILRRAQKELAKQTPNLICTGEAVIPVAQPDIGALELAYAQRAVKSGWVSSLGSRVELME